MAEDREIAGVRCLQILEKLDDYMDGQLDLELRAKVDAHLKECDWCARFGGRYIGTIQALRSELTKDDARSAAFARDLLNRQGN